MVVKISCPRCSQHYNIEDDMYGYVVECQICNCEFTLAAPEPQKLKLSRPDGPSPEAAAAAAQQAEVSEAAGPGVSLLPYIVAMAIIALALVAAVALLLIPAVDASIILLGSVAGGGVVAGLIAFFIVRAAKAAEEEPAGFINVDMTATPEYVLQTAIETYQGSMDVQETWADSAVLVSYEGGAVVMIVLKVSPRDERTTRLRGDIYGESSSGMIVLGAGLIVLGIPLSIGLIGIGMIFGGLACLKSGKRKAKVHVKNAMPMFDQIKRQVGGR
jgi:hypothetical protein